MVNTAAVATTQHHRCAPPRHTPGRRVWCCPTCGAGWAWTTRHLTDGPLSGWARNRVYDSQLVRDAWQYEQIANMLPWWRWVTRWQLRRHAADNRTIARVIL
ncbi:hypothetical protein [Pseudonocardia asaccharolytica]|uniref:Uncharacterized protein n=1 Tax=Pseudonocardia asaccharolytica DSM 44247 = NBRC 16224 TaxID=1123024 RepID=A0A511D8R9_9PSEU|nr:hypothetical protein [Pseudonocardia asaccharolytica]GEL19338.1 hypothetical protein PA7_31750 [Pseudonocardia asaccharolytica DSM 44247 = NBRC 16224]